MKALHLKVRQCLQHDLQHHQHPQSHHHRDHADRPLRLFAAGLASEVLLAMALMLPPARAASHGANQAAKSGRVDGLVTQVIDGNTLVLSPADKPSITVRLADSDAPELCQVHGAEARQALADMALNQRAQWRPRGRDAQGRMLGFVQVAGLDMGTRMVEEGQAWSVRVKWDNGPLVRQERMARALARGLHGKPDAMKPADFRRAHGPCL